MQNQNNPSNVLPWTKEQFEQMKTMLNVTIPAHEDTLKRTEASGIDVTVLKQQLADQKAQLQKMVDAWKDKYK